MTKAFLNRVLALALPAVPKAIVRPLAASYIAGPTLADAVATVRELEAGGRAATIDVLGEQLTTSAEVDALVAEYLRVLEVFQREKADATLSVKPTGLGLKLAPERALDNLRALARAARERSIDIEIDMEDSTTTSATLELYRALREEGHENLVLALQAYLRRTRHDLRMLIALRPRVRLVKGIWVESSDVAYHDYDTVRAEFAVLLRELLDAGARVAIASHDEWVHSRALELIRERDLRPDEYEFQMLLGVREELGNALLAAGHRVRVYVPYGADWHAYSLRRFKENPQLAGWIAADVLARTHRRLRRQ